MLNASVTLTNRIAMYKLESRINNQKVERKREDEMHVENE
jgi:hypothetical protein